MNQTQTVDPITTAVVHNTLLAAAREMRDTIQRTSFSPIIYEDRDFACGLLDAEANTLAESPGLTAFMGTLSPGIKKSFEERGMDDLEPGDIYITSMPAFTGSHPADMMLWMPIYYGDRLFGFAASKAHLVDVGAKDPYPTDSTDAFQEGLRLPPIKLYRAGKLDETLASVIKSNSRAPEIIWGDIHSQIACFRSGEQSVIRLLDKYGFDTVYGCINEIYDHAERMARDAIRQMPAGTWTGIDYCDDNGIDRGVPLKVGVAVTIDPVAAEVTFDYSESAEQQRGPMNVPLITAISVSRMLGKILSAPDSAACEGSFRPIKIVAPKGSLFNPHDAAPTNLYGWPGMTAIEATMSAMAPDFPDRFPAQSGGDLCAVFRYGFDPVTSEMWVEANIDGIGMGASASADGESAMVHILEACSRNLPVELEEAKDPEIIERYELRQDSGGAGKFRGGLGIQRDYRLLADGRMISVLERCIAPHAGVAGGLPGGRTYGVLDSSIYGQGFEIIKTPDQPIAKGDLLSIRSGGGGGFGNPLERDPDKVLEDVLEELVSIEAAQELYGVVFDDQGNIDYEDTARVRATRMAAA
ncbi:MAG: hydantoinase B/oxoprolinase family protein [Thermomicrobiales bacterium]|nr:hydantoinase B/oxoprolinase family protein [Thermomicrobiales bacterium]